MTNLDNAEERDQFLGELTKTGEHLATRLQALVNFYQHLDLSTGSTALNPHDSIIDDIDFLGTRYKTLLLQIDLPSFPSASYASYEEVKGSYYFRNRSRLSETSMPERTLSATQISSLKNVAQRMQIRFQSHCDDVTTFIKYGSEEVSDVLQSARSEFLELHERLEGFVGKDVELLDGTNVETLDMREAELSILREALKIAIKSTEIPHWSKAIQFHIRGLYAALAAMMPLVSKLKPLAKKWNDIMDLCEKLAKLMKFDLEEKENQ